MCSQLSVKIQTDEIEFRAKVQFFSHKILLEVCVAVQKKPGDQHHQCPDDHQHHDHYDCVQLSSREREIDWEIREMQKQQVLFKLT